MKVIDVADKQDQYSEIISSGISAAEDFEMQ